MAGTTGKIAMRSKVHAYMNMGTAETPEWSRCGKGWTKLGENPNAQTESTQYIDEDSATEDTVSYSPKYNFECDLMYTEETIKKIYDIAKQRKTGSDCVVDMVFVDAFEDAASDGTYTAYRESLAVAVSSLDGTKKMTMSGSLNCQGDGVKGTFNTSTKTFTSAASE